MFLDRLFKFLMIAPQLWNKFVQYLPDEAYLELAAATNGRRFYTKSKMRLSEQES